jgi:hypothetical protein
MGGGLAKLKGALEGRRRPQRGCLAAAVGSLALVVLAPFAALARGWQARRRGDAWRIESAADPAAGTGPARRTRLHLRADIPLRSGAGFRSRLTDAVVRIAEQLRQTDDVYHHVYRIPGEADAVVLPVGPQVQALGDRLVLALGQTELAHRTAVWLTLPAPRPITELVESATYDPEAAGEPEGLVERSNPRWAMATGWAQIGPSTVYRLDLWLPEDSVQAVEKLLDRLEPRRPSPRPGVPSQTRLG